MCVAISKYKGSQRYVISYIARFGCITINSVTGGFTSLRQLQFGLSVVCALLLLPPPSCPSILQDYPNLTTFFEGEIISHRHPFLTRKWDASEEVDRKHWGKFAPFRPFMKTFNSDDFSYDQMDDTDFVFMRWKVSGWC